jgi:hypothetical protein
MSRSPGVFRSRPLAWLVAISIGATLAAVVLLVFGAEFAGGVTAGHGTNSDSAVGHRAAFEFLKDGGWSASRNFDPRVPALRSTAALVLIEPDGNVEQSSDLGVLPHLIALAQQRKSAVVVVLPKWIASTSPLDRRYVDGVTPIGTGTARAIAAASTGVDPSTFEFRTLENRTDCRVDTAWGEKYEVSLFRTQFLVKNPALMPLITCLDNVLAASIVRPGAPPILVVADPDLINNQGLGKADHAALLADLLGHIEGVHELVFDEMIHGETRRGNALAFAGRSKALPVALQLILIGGAALWAFSGRFGNPPETRAARGGREVFIETTARLLEGSVGEGSSLARYWRDAIDAVSRARRIVPGRGPAGLARLAGESSASGATDDVETLAAEIAAAAEGNPRSNAWIAAAMKVHRWRREMTHGSRTTR